MCLYEFYSMHALKWNLYNQKQRFTFLQNFVLGIRLARWSSGSRFLETLWAAAPVLIVIYPLPPLLCLHYPPLFGHHRACLGTKTKDGPRYLALSVAWIEGWGTMFGCFNAALIPLSPPSSSLPAIKQYCFGTYLTHIPPNSLPHPYPIQFSTAKTPNSTPVSGMQSPPPRIPQIPSENFFLPPSPSPLPVWMKPECPPCPELQIKQISG